jgi:UbiD family decarboxylase
MQAVYVGEQQGSRRFSCCPAVISCTSLLEMKQGDMSIPAVTGKAGLAAETDRFEAGTGPADLREYLERIERAGELKRITAEVDPIEEMSAIVYLAARQIGAPAFLFENVKGYDTPVLWNMWGSSANRLATAIGVPMGLSHRDLVLAVRHRLGRKIAPVMADSPKAAVFANTVAGNDVDVYRFPAPKHWPLDGGRYIGTCDAVITRDPERGHLNVGTYRMMIHDRNHVALYMSPGKDARLHMERWWAQGKPCEVIALWGVDPATFLLSGIALPKTESELDYIGGLKGKAVELLNGKFTSLQFPAGAEIVMEGVAYPNDVKKEGPFGEFTGYYARPNDPSPQVEVKAIHYRKKPILTAALMADYWPSNDSALQFAVIRAGRVWNDLDKLGVPGIKGVYAHPAAAGGFGMMIVSLEQRYPGHAQQVLALAAQCPGGAYFTKWIIAVDDDIDPTDINEVLWAMATRCNPADGIELLKNTWSTGLDPAQNPPEKRPYGSKALINACMDHKHLKTFSKRSKLRKDMYERIGTRWKELGFTQDFPNILTFEDKETL